MKKAIIVIRADHPFSQNLYNRYLRKIGAIPGVLLSRAHPFFFAEASARFLV